MLETAPNAPIATRMLRTKSTYMLNVMLLMNSWFKYKNGSDSNLGWILLSCWMAQGYLDLRTKPQMICTLLYILRAQEISTGKPTVLCCTGEGRIKAEIQRWQRPEKCKKSWRKKGLCIGWKLKWGGYSRQRVGTGRSIKTRFEVKSKKEPNKGHYKAVAPSERLQPSNMQGR